MADGYRIGEAAALLGVRAETIRRWERAGKIRTLRTTGGQRLIPAPEVARLLAKSRTRAPRATAAGSARNRFAGVITAIKRDKIVATVEIMAGPHRVLALTTREAVDEMRLRPGMEAVATIKATNVVVELPV
ncbi:MAG: helix-turn-helix transcriptional regulator [Actinomycetota bacterium]|jgi:molybdopterin-binding protein